MNRTSLPAEQGSFTLAKDELVRQRWDETRPAGPPP
jgi:hypothetical protein